MILLSQGLRPRDRGVKVKGQRWTKPIMAKHNTQNPWESLRERKGLEAFRILVPFTGGRWGGAGIGGGCGDKNCF